MPLSVYPPMSCEDYEVKLADGFVQQAFWSGKAWWHQGKVITPASWRIIAVVAA